MTHAPGALWARAAFALVSLNAPSSAGVTLIELLIAVLLFSFLSFGIVLTLRVALNGMNKSDSKLMANRRVSSIERILDQEIEGIMPVTAHCQPQPGSWARR